MSSLNNYSRPDEELVTAILKDDPDSFKQLYYRYHKPLIRFAWFRLHSMETAQDLVQDLFFKVWANKHHLDPAKSVKAYLYKSLNNLIINHNNLHSSHNSSLEIIENKKNREEINPDAGIDIREAIDHLPEKLKTTYILSRLEGYKYSEIAEICNISLKAVEKRMSQAFNCLRKIFPEEYFNEQ